MRPLFAKRASQKPSSISKNAVSQTVPIFIAYGASFVSAPIVLNGLGLRAYGIWSLTGGLAAYGSLLNLGLGRAMSRFIAGYDAQGQERMIGEVMAIALLGTLVVALPLAALAIGAAGPVAAAIGGIGTAKMRTLLLCAVGMTILAMFGDAMTGWPRGLRRMLAPSVALAAGSLINFVLSVTVILLGGDLIQYALANLIASVLGLVVVVVIVFATEGIPPYAWPSLRHFREVIAFAVKGQLVVLCDLVNYQSDKIVIGLAIGPAAAGAYSIANTVSAAARTVGVYAQTALIPAFAARVAEEGTSGLRSVYRQMTTRSSSVSFPGLFFVAATSPLLLSAWLGRIPMDGAAILFVLSIAYIANVSSGVSYAMASAGNALGLPARTAIITALANIAFTAGLAPLFGVWGVLSGTFIALTVGAVLQIVLVQGHFDIPQRTHWNAVRESLGLCSVLAVPIFAISLLTSSGVSRLFQIGTLALCGIAYGVLYFAAAARRDLLPGALTRRITRVRIAAQRS